MKNRNSEPTVKMTFFGKVRVMKRSFQVGISVSLPGVKVPWMRRWLLKPRELKILTPTRIPAEAQLEC